MRSGRRSWHQPYKQRIPGEPGLIWGQILGQLRACPVRELARQGEEGQVSPGSVSPGRKAWCLSLGLTHPEEGGDRVGTVFEQQSWRKPLLGLLGR